METTKTTVNATATATETVLNETLANSTTEKKVRTRITESWSEVKNLEYLKNITNDNLGTKHIAYQHHEAISNFNNHLKSMGIEWTGFNCIIEAQLDKTVYVVDIPVSDTYSMQLGFINYNNTKKAYTGVLGIKLSNGKSILHEVRLAKSKHLANAVAYITEKNKFLFGEYIKHRDVANQLVERLTTLEITELDKKELVWYAHQTKALNATKIDLLFNRLNKASVKNGVDILNSIMDITDKFTNPLTKFTANENFNVYLYKMLDIEIEPPCEDVEDMEDVTA